MKRILIIVSAIVVILAIAIITLPFLIPSSVYKAQIEKAATTALGREVTLLGEAKLSIFPVISAKIGGAQVGNPEGFEGDYIIEAGELKGSVKLWPLFSRKVEISEITLTDATIRLERLSDGRANWQFGTPGIDPDGDPGDETGAGLNTGIARARLTNAAIYFTDHPADQHYTLTRFNAEARLIALDQPFTSKGDGLLNGQPFDYDISMASFDLLSNAQPAALNLDLTTDFGRIQYDGTLTLGDLPVFDGAFDVRSDTFGPRLDILAPDLPFKASEIKSLHMSGRMSGPTNDLVLDFANLDLKATGLTLGYTGEMRLAQTASLNGNITLDADRAQRLLKPGQTPLAALTAPLAVLGEINLTSAVRGTLTEPSFSNIKLKQRSNLLSTDFQGAVSLSGDQALNGTLSTSSNDLRGLLTQLAIEPPPSESLNNFSLSGDAQGSLSNPTLSSAKLALDETTATGSLGADLGGTRPRITADLTMPVLDLSPFLGTENSNTQPNPDQDWNDDPLALDGLKALNATVNITAGKVILDQITLEDALLKTRLDDGRLSAIFRQDEDRPGFKVFDGNWSGDLVLDASHGTPTLEIEALADSIAAQKMLGALTGFNSLKGIGDIHIDLTSSGNSLKALVNGLDGRMEADLSNGAIRGLNLAKLVRDGANLTDLLRSGNLSVASFQNAFSPEAETDFSSLIGGLNFTNGVAQITSLKLDNPVVAITGTGSIDLGARTIDISLVPSFDASAQRQGSSLTLNDIPIPVRVYGSWSNIKFELDSRAVQAELTARARGAIAGEIADQVGGPLGGILGQVITGGSPTVPAQPAEDTATDTAPDIAPETPTEAPKSLEDEIKDRAIEGALGAIFGDQNKPDEAAGEEVRPD